MNRGGRRSGWGWRSRSRLEDQGRMKSWKEVVAADGAFSGDVALVNLPLVLRSGLLGWAAKGRMVWMTRMNGGAGP